MNALFQNAVDTALEQETRRNVVMTTLTDLRLAEGDESRDKIMVGDEMKTLSPLALRSLCYHLGIPFQVDEFVGNSHPDLRKELVTRARSRGTEGMFQAICSNGELTSLIPENMLVMPNSAFLTKLWELLPENVRASEDNVEVFVNPKEVSVLIKNPMESEIIPNDTFRIGLTLSNSPIYVAPITARLAFERMFCTNLSYTSDRSSTFKFRHKDKGASDLREWISRPLHEVFNDDWQKGFKKQISMMQNTELSLRELLWYRKYFNSQFETDEGDCKIGAMEEKLPLLRVLDKFGIDPDRLNSRSNPISDKWQSSAKTPITAYYLYDLMTQEARHNDALEPDEKDRLRLFSGTLLTRQFDMDQTAPSVEFESTLERYQPIIGSQN